MFRNPTALALSAASLLALTLAPGEASAQVTGFTADRLILAPNPDDGFASMRPTFHERTRFFGNLTLDYIRRPVKTSNAIGNPRIQDAFSAGFISNQANANLTIGAEFLQRFSLSFTAPITVFNTTGITGDARGALSGGIDPKAPAVGDVRLDGRARLYSSASQKFHLGLGATYFVGTGNEGAFAGDGDAHGLLQILLEERPSTSLILTQFLGVHFRNKNELGDPGASGLYFSNELVFGAGAFIPLRDNRVRVGAEIFGSTGLGTVDTKLPNEEAQTTFKRKYTPVEWLGQVRVALDQRKQLWFNGGAGSLIVPGYSAPDFRVIAQIGYWFEIRDTDPPSPPREFRIKPEERIPDQAPDRDGDGIPDAIDACPDIPEDRQPPDPNDGCPGPKDRDKDGIPDDKDRCPDDPEDRDGFEDEDGCPDPDNDKDGIPDLQDACPREPGQPSPDPKQNGCPQFIRRIEGSNEIQILKKIEFDTGKATIKKNSFAILDEVVSLLKANPGIKKIRIEGHTDSRGGRDMNMKLSADRAASCLKYLTDHGIDAGRLVSEGFGPDKPIDDNKTEPGRQKNRRVEFHIVEQE
jgi:outer membrane protein OmpA-like peptidoglycan-associated protein